VSDQREAVEAAIEQLPKAKVNQRVLSELLYTAQERGMFEGEGMSDKDALLAANLVALATDKEVCPEEWRM
jgi:hypothetical protein